MPDQDQTERFNEALQSVREAQQRYDASEEGIRAARLTELVETIERDLTDDSDRECIRRMRTLLARLVAKLVEGEVLPADWPERATQPIPVADPRLEAVLRHLEGRHITPAQQRAIGFDRWYTRNALPGAYGRHLAELLRRLVGDLPEEVVNRLVGQPPAIGQMTDDQPK